MSFKRHIPKIVGTLMVVVVSGLMMYFVKGFLDTPATTQKKSVQQITLLTPPPPPPPQEKLPEPEVEEEVKIEEPEPLDEMPEEAADEAPAGEELGVDAEGGAGGDGFGLIGRKGGRGLLEGSGDPFNYFGSQLSRRIEDALLDVEDLRTRGYSVVLEVWVGTDGRVTRARLASSTGNRDTDALMNEAILRAQAVAQAPPPGMPQPIRLRVSSRL